MGLMLVIFMEVIFSLFTYVQEHDVQTWIKIFVSYGGHCSDGIVGVIASSK